MELRRKSAVLALQDVSRKSVDVDREGGARMVLVAEIIRTTGGELGSTGSICRCASFRVW
jgi:hypothetical protein